MFRCMTFILLILFLSISFIYADTSLRLRGGDCDAQNTGAWPAFGCNMARTSRTAIAASMSGIKIQWTYNAGSTISGPAVEDHNQRIFFGTSSGYLYCLTATGKLVWRFRAQNPIGKSAVIDDYGKIYFGDTGGYLYSLFFDGNLQWRSQLSGRINYGPGYDGSSTIYVVTDQSGSRLYAHRVNEPSYKWYKYDSGTYAYCDVVVDAQARSYITNYSSKTYYCWDRNGTELWHKTMSWAYVWGLCLDEANSQMYSAAWNNSTNKHNIHAFNPANGDSLWTYETTNQPTVPVAIDSQGRIYFGDTSYYFYCVTKDGAQAY
ncbi:MAG: PQQ-like beta-propeller repeat protein, partial [Candidatus Coatesbacteria bacterium]|nr:PQQ-like beta-propeller repeat protein [Candidatus Coatesbacteria bacterium]